MRPGGVCDRHQREPYHWADLAARLDKRGYIETDAELATSMAGVFAGGDIVTGAATVIEAMGAGRKAARSMQAYLAIGAPERSVEATTIFGIQASERNFARILCA